MTEVAKGGRTVLYVSHNMASIQRLCHRGLLLDTGKLISTGSICGVIGDYLRMQEKASEIALQHFQNRTGNRQVIFTYFEVRDKLGHPITKVQSGQDVLLVFGYRSREPFVDKRVNVGFGIHSSTGERLTVLYSSHTGQELYVLPITGEFHCEVKRFPFNPGRYYMYPRIEVNGVESDYPRDGVGCFDVESGDFYYTGRQTIDRSYSPFLMVGNWRLSQIKSGLSGELVARSNNGECSETLE